MKLNLNDNVDEKYPYLKKLIEYDNEALNYILEYSLGGAPRSAIWSALEVYTEPLNFTYLQMRKLFLELIEYWLRERIMIFSDTEVELDPVYTKR